MELRVLRYFLAIAKEESISGAAKVLNVTQPTLSKQLMDLEDELNTKLFVRGNRKMSLTDSGKLLKKRAQEIVELVDKSENEILHASNDISGSIAIGSGETEGVRFIGKVAVELLKHHKNIKYHLYSGNAEEVMERLDNGILDFGVVIGDVNIEKYNYLLLPMVDTWGLLCQKSSPLSNFTSICREDISDLPLIFSRQTLSENELSKWFHARHSDLNIVATYNLIYNAAIMVEEGLGYALCLDNLVNTTNISGLSFIPLEPKIEIPLNIIWKKSQFFTKTSAEFLNTLQEFLKKE